MTAAECRDLTPQERLQKLQELRQELFKLAVRRAVGPVENPARIRLLRRDVARLLTVQREQERAPAGRGTNG